MTDDAFSMDPSAIRRRARKSLVDTMDDVDQTPAVRRAAAEALLKDIEDVGQVDPKIIDMSDAELIQVILDWQAQSASPQNTESPISSVEQTAIFDRPGTNVTTSPQVVTIVPTGTTPANKVVTEDPPRGTLAERLASQLAGIADKDPLCQ